MNRSFLLGVLVTALVAVGVFVFWKAADRPAPAPMDLGTLPTTGSTSEEKGSEETSGPFVNETVRDSIALETYFKQNTTSSLQFEYFGTVSAPQSATTLELNPWSGTIDLVESGIADAITTGSLLYVESVEFFPEDNRYGDLFRVFFFEASDREPVLQAIQPTLSYGRWGGIPTYETSSTEACEPWMVDSFEDCTVFKMKGTPLAYEITTEGQLRDLKYSEGEAVLIRYGVEGQTSLYALFYFDKTRLEAEFENFKSTVLNSIQN